MSSFFQKQKETDWFNPNSHSEVTLADKQDEVLKIMCLKGITWASELGRDIGLNQEEINRILYNLKRLGYVEKIYPDPQFPQAPFRGRMAELWSRGIIGYNLFATYSWWILTEGGIHYVKAKYPKTKIRAGLANHYSLLVISDKEQPEENLDTIFDEFFSEQKDLNTTLPSNNHEKQANING